MLQLTKPKAKCTSFTYCVESVKIIVCWSVCFSYKSMVKWFLLVFIQQHRSLTVALKRLLQSFTGRIRKRPQLFEVHIFDFMAFLWMSQASVLIDLHIKYISNKTTSCCKPIVKSIVIGTKILWVLGLQSYCLCNWPVKSCMFAW